ncbi:polysaccharide pyruvyl transferase family protein [Enterococcus avium]|uniref:polysaccharide pyruvyl transferase family protein n=1 Tax=Enterococcus avium TaxID=33945 RepID=UPI0037945D24
MKKIVIHGATWTDNFGDTLFFEVFGNKIINLGYEPILVKADNNLVKQLSFNIKNYQNLNEALQEASAIVYVGGGYFGEAPNISRIRRLLWSIKLYLKCYRLGVLTAQKKKPMIILGVGAGPVHINFIKKTILKICNSSMTVVVRDVESQEFLSMLGVSEKKLLTTADTLIAVDSIFPESGSRKNIILVHLQDVPDNSKKVRSIVEQLDKFILKFPTYSVIGIGDQVGNPGQDAWLEYCSIHFGTKSIKYTNPRKLIHDLAKGEIVITEKLHVGIISASYNNSVYSLPRHDKTKRFYKQIGYAERVITDNELFSEGLLSKMIKFKSTPIEVPTFIKDGSKLNLDILTNFLDELK